MHSESLKFTVKSKNEKRPATDELSCGEGRADTPVMAASNHQDQVENSFKERVNNGDIEDEENQHNQLALTAGEPSVPPKRNSFTDRTPVPSIGAFAVQCSNCFKWRLVPTMEKYEEIRECIVEKPFFCEAGREWKPEMSCDDPTDISPGGNRVWAIDKPSIPRPPSGWQRLLRFRGEGGSKFADVYYAAPSGKRLRSLIEVQRFLKDHPEYLEEGVVLSKFSFQVPKPLQESYVRKRTPRLLINDNGSPGLSESLQPTNAVPLSWCPPDIDTEIRPGLADDRHGSPLPELECLRNPPSN